MANTPPKHKHQNIAVLWIGSSPHETVLTMLNDCQKLPDKFSINFVDGLWGLKQNGEWVDTPNQMGRENQHSKGLKPGSIFGVYDVSIAWQKTKALADEVWVQKQLKSR